MASSDIQPYPLQFDPSQWANKYSAFAGQKLPSLAAYAGTPTDAHGNPISSYQAFLAQQAATPPMAPPTMLNSSPVSGGMSGGAYGDWRTLVGGGAGASPQANQYAYNVGLGGVGPAGSLNPGSAAGQAWLRQAGAQQATPQAPPTQAPDMGQAYLAALSNPGKIATPGATIPQSAPPSANSGVLQQFLQNWQNKGSPTTGAGNYNNQGFFAGLQGGQNA
jgi:hypothetical protein